MNTVINPDTRLSLDQILSAVPVHNRSVECVRDAENEIVLRVPLRKRWYMGRPLSWFLPFRTHHAIALDSMGREVWKACDGKRCAEAIIEAFAQRHHVSFHEARMGVLEFLKSLTRRGLVVIVGQGGKGGAD